MGRMKGDSEIGVYMLHNQETGEAYIGSGILNARRNAHFSLLQKGKHRNYLLQSSYSKNPNFDFIGVPVEGDDKEQTRKEALALEALLVSEFSDSPRLLNLMREKIEESTNLSHSQETLERLREHTAKRWQNPEWREKVLVAQNAGKQAMTPEQLAEKSRRLSESIKHAYDTGVKVSNAGQIRSEEFRQNNSRNIAQLWKDPSYRERQMTGRVGKSPEPTNKRACCVAGVLYDSVTSAANACGLTKQGALYRLDTPSYSDWNFI